MNHDRENPTPIPRTLPELAHALGYCCPYAFFRVHKKVRSGLIATRLGVGARTVKLWRRRYKEGELACIGLDKCFAKRAKPRP